MASSPRSWSTEARLDALGLALVVGLVLWVGFFAGDGRGRPGPVLWLLAGMVLAFTVARSLAWRPGVVHRVIALAIAGSVVLTWPGILEASGPPTGYANANATLTALGVIASVGAAAQARRGADRRAWVALAGALALATVLTDSVAGVASLAVALALLGLSHATSWPGFVVVGGLIAVSLLMGITVALALRADLGGLGERAGIRGELWNAAAELAQENPLRGVGPGEFAAQNPVTRDADLRWAHHGILQVAAELGAVGLLLVLSIAGWAWARLWHGSRPFCLGNGLAASAITIVGLHAAVDYVLHGPAVVVVHAALVGSSTRRGVVGSGAAWSRRPHRPEP